MAHNPAIFGKEITTVCLEASQKQQGSSECGVFAIHGSSQKIFPEWYYLNQII